MLGYVQIFKPELKVREYEVYMGYYCGVCKYIGAEYGQLPRMVLSYDAAFLALLLACVDETPDAPVQEHCIAHHIKDKTIIRNRAVEYAGDVMLILAWYKMLDDAQDEGKIYAKASARLLKRLHRKLVNKYPALCDGIEINLAKLNGLEKAKCASLDEAAESFSKIMDVIFREGDRLIQNRNDYNVLWECADGSSGLGVFNGDIGLLKEINVEDQTMTVDFDGREATYDFESLGDLEHAWALTVHKSQGSEYRAVILALTDSSRRLLTRTVLYTAVTRARELLIMVGNENIAFRMIDNVAPSRRYNALRIRIREACGK